MTKISNLPRDLMEEVLCKIPLTSLRRVRSTCKSWNNLSKGLSFAKKHLDDQAKLAASREREHFMVVMMTNFGVYLMSVNLDNNNVESSIKRQGKLISLDDEIDDVSQLFHCDGLLLCITKDNTRLIVWNPYWGQIRRIKHTSNVQVRNKYSYALGYDKGNKSYKILSFINIFNRCTLNYVVVEFKIYDFNSDSWRVLDITIDWRLEYYTHIHGVSLKGNTYWFARKKYSNTFLVCFDFTRETFGPALPLPFEYYDLGHIVSLSSIREEQLAVLFHSRHSLKIEIWITSKIESNAVSWNNKVFLEVNITNPRFLFSYANFFIDEEKKVVVVFDKDKYMRNPTRNIAYIIGVDGFLKEVDLGESGDRFCYPRVYPYVPSLVQFN